MTICDELIWECLLAECPCDLIVVTKDAGFLGHAQMLKEEFESAARPQRGGDEFDDGKRELTLTNDLGEALKKVGKTAKGVEKEKQYVPPEYPIGVDRGMFGSLLGPWITSGVSCPECGRDVLQVVHEEMDSTMVLQCKCGWSGLA